MNAKIVAVIPARGGSKRIPGKNIKTYCGKPLIYWSINIAQQSKYITDIVLSTDCPKIANVGKEYGACVPFLRPSAISGDLATDHEFMIHYLRWAKTNNEYPDLIIQLRPTYPNRKLDILDDCIKTFLNKPNYDSLRTVCPTEKPPYKMYTVQDNKLVPLFLSVGNIMEPYNQPAQILPITYWHNGYIDIVKPATIINGSVSGKHIYPYVMDKSEIDDIDTMNEWTMSEKKMLNFNHYIYPKQKNIV